MYVAVKGGERAIENAHRLLAHERRGDPNVPEVSLAQISEQLSLGVDRVMTEGSLYDRELAALAIKQAQVGADLQDLEGRVRRQQRVEGGIQGLQCGQRFIEHGFEIEHFDDRRCRQLGQIDTGERAGCHG